MTDTSDLSGSVVLVTGGTRGVGRGITEAFLAEGAEVVTCGRNEPEGAPSVNGRAASFVAADVREPDQVDAMVAGIAEDKRRLDIVINNAGGAPATDAATASPRFSTRIVQLNLLAPLFVAQAANRVMQAQDQGGSIVNIASVSALRPSPGTAAYGAAKAGLVSLTQSLAVEWAPRVRVNAVSAGMIRTEQADLHYGDADGIARVAATVPLGRLGEPSDVGGACIFLASSQAAYVSGANLVVHGGGEAPAFLSAAERPNG
jgi:NAD(P)-dependent dehydrogenase (short-subunit alcohol dehydrogenase family)